MTFSLEDMKPMSRNVTARISFYDYDGTYIEKGTFLGDIYRMGCINKQPAYNAIVDNKVVAVFTNLGNI